MKLAPSHLCFPVTESDDDRWQEKFREEQRRTEEQQQQHAEQLRLIQNESDATIRKIANFCAFTADHRQRCLGDLCFDAWCQWVAKEKFERQFNQLSHDIENCGSLRATSIKQLSKDSSDLDASIGLCKSQAALQQARWSAALDHAINCFDSQEHYDCLEMSFLAWRSHKREARSATFMVKVWEETLRQELLLIPFQAWYSQIGEENHQNLVSQYEVSEQVVLRLGRKQAVTRLDKALCRLAQVRLDFDAFEQWSSYALQIARLRAQARRIAGCSNRMWALDAVVLSVILTTWHSAVSKAEVRISAERTARRQLFVRRKRLTTTVFESVCNDAASFLLLHVLCRWHTLTTYTVLQRQLESCFADKEASQSNLLRQQLQLSGLQSKLDREEESWQAERLDLLERLQYLELEQENVALKVAEVHAQLVDIFDRNV